MRNLKLTTVNSIDMSGLGWYVPAFGEFDSCEFAAHVGVDHSDIDEQDIKRVSDRASEIQEGQFVLVDVAD